MPKTFNNHSQQQQQLKTQNSNNLPPQLDQSSKTPEIEHKTTTTNTKALSFLSQTLSYRKILPSSYIQDPKQSFSTIANNNNKQQSQETSPSHNNQQAKTITSNIKGSNFN